MCQPGRTSKTTLVFVVILAKTVWGTYHVSVVEAAVETIEPQAVTKKQTMVTKSERIVSVYDAIGVLSHLDYASRSSLCGSMWGECYG